MIDRDLKRVLGEMAKGVQVVAATYEGVTRGYCSHWVTQVAFEEPLVMASASPKHDTFPLMVGAGWFTVSILAGDQIDVGQYFSYPGRRFRQVASEWLVDDDGNPVVPDAIGWMRCEIIDQRPMGDHELFFARVTRVGEGRLKEPPLVYSARQGWRVASDKARTDGRSVRDELLDRLAGSPPDGDDAVSG